MEKWYRDCVEYQYLRNYYSEEELDNIFEELIAKIFISHCVFVSKNFIEKILKERSD